MPIPLEKLGFFCSSSSMGGLEMNTARLAKWMQDAGWKIVFYCREGTPIEAYAKDLGLPISYVQKHRKYYDLVGASRLTKKFAEDDVRIVLFRDNYDMSALTMAKARSKDGLKLIYIQAMQLGGPKRDLLHTWRFSRIDIWISLLHFMADQVRTMTRVDHDKIRVIPLGMEMDRFNKDVVTQEVARGQLGLPKDMILAGVVGRFDVRKGQHTAIEALAKIRKTNVGVGLVLMGEPTKNEGVQYEQKLRSAVEELQLSDVVFFLSFRKDVELFYRAIDQFWMTSKGETFGNVTIEAMASRLAIIGTNSSGTPELLGKGKFGRLIPPDNPEQLAKEALWIIENPEAANLMANRAATESRRFDHKVVAEKIGDVIERLILRRDS